MSTVDKALSILDLFSETDPTLRLSEIARRLGWDKSNVQRYLTDLTARRILEQDGETRAYYLGASITRLAMVRERTNPVAAETMKVLKGLVEATGETAHASELIGQRLMTTAMVETNVQATRVYLDQSAPLPLHASGSGIAVLSALSEDHVKLLLAGDITAFTATTPTEMADILGLITTARDCGYAKMDGTFESDVVGIGVPIRGYSGQAIGAVAVATPIARFDSSNEQEMAKNIIAATRQLSRCYGAA